MNRKVAASAAMALIMALSASAAVVVDFTGGTVDDDVNARVVDIDTNTGDTWNFSDSIILIDSTNQSDGTVYGGVITTWVANQAYAPPVRMLDGNLQVQVNPTTATDTAAKGIFLWNLSSSAVLGSGSSLDSNIQLTASSREARLVVNQGGTYYVSSSSTDINGTADFNILDIGAETWAEIDTSNYSIISGFSSLPLNAVDGVGIYFNLARTGNQTIFKVNDLQVTAVPEPTTFALISGFLVLGLVLRRRSKV